MFTVNLKEVFDRIEVDPVECDGCSDISKTHEEWGEEEICNGNKFDCPRVRDKVEELNEFMADNAEYFELITEVK